MKELTEIPVVAKVQHPGHTTQSIGQWRLRRLFLQHSASIAPSTRRPARSQLSRLLAVRFCIVDSPHNERLPALPQVHPGHLSSAGATAIGGGGQRSGSSQHRALAIQLLFDRLDGASVQAGQRWLVARGAQREGGTTANFRTCHWLRSGCGTANQWGGSQGAILYDRGKGNIPVSRGLLFA